MMSLSQIVSRLSLAGLLGKSHGNKRDLYEEVGWQKILTFDDYMSRFKRQGIASRIVTAPVDATWRGIPEIQQADSGEEETTFEKEIKKMIKDLSIFKYCARADILAGIGQFSVIFLGVGSEGQAVNLEQALSKTGANVLQYLSVYSQANVEIREFDVRPGSPRFGLPEIYEIDFSRNASSDAPPGSVVPKRIGKTRVHWSRVVHVCNGLLEDEVYGTPALESVWNNLQSLETITGGSGEMYWQGAFPGTAFEADKESDFIEGSLGDDMKEDIEKYMHGLQRYLTLIGVKAHQLAPAVADPTPFIDAHITQISAAKSIPKRILTGSERGELASTQDQENWESVIDSRRKDYAEPVILRPLIDRIVEYQMVSLPGEEYEIEWPDIEALTETELATVNTQKIEMLAKYAGTPGADAVLPIETFLRKFLKLDENEIQDAVKEFEAAMEEARAQQEEIARQQQQQQQQQQQTSRPGGTNGGAKPNTGVSRP